MSVEHPGEGHAEIGNGAVSFLAKRMLRPIANAVIRDASMNNSESENLNDELIGEAVLFLLKSKGPITTQSLLTALRVMESGERDPVRRQALAGIVAEISNLAVASNGSSDRDSHIVDSRKNGFPRFDVSTSHAGGKKMH